MTIHSTNPFAADDPDPARRLRGRLGGAVTLWTSGSDADRAGLTVGSLMIALGPRPVALALVDPDSDLLMALRATGRAVVHWLGWQDRELADVFAGVFPAPGGPFRTTEWEQTSYGPRMRTAQTFAEVALDTERDVGWSTELTVGLERIVLGVDVSALEHRRGRYREVEH